MRISLDDDDLFGNEAAEDERQDVFEAYAYERPEVERFCDAGWAIQLVRAYKGEGKSALMRIARTRIESTSAAGTVTIDASGPALSPELEGSTEFAKWVRAWKEKIVELIQRDRRGYRFCLGRRQHFSRRTG